MILNVNCNLKKIKIKKLGKNLRALVGINKIITPGSCPGELTIQVTEILEHYG